MIKISGCLFWLQSTLFKSCFSDVADFLRTEGGDAGSPRFAISVPLCSLRTDVLVPSSQGRAETAESEHHSHLQRLKLHTDKSQGLHPDTVSLTTRSQAFEVSCLPHNTGIRSNYYHLEPCLHLEQNANSGCNYSLN